ncbi:soluble quino protein glucose dehydrogenase [Serendipita vermifera]|nr:soluble quino protein glucose dehydrogenase [Serendipita vermifera]
MKLTWFLIALSYVLDTQAQCQTKSSLSWKHKPDVKDKGHTTLVIASGLTRPRGIKWANGTLLVASDGVGLVALVENANGCDGWTQSVLVSNPDLNHGLWVDGAHIYASSVENVFRYTWDPSTRNVSTTETLVSGMNLAQNHKTRTLVLAGNYLYVSGGASENLELESSDPTHGTAQVRRFAVNGTIPSGGYQWLQGEVAAWGMRNAVGMVLSPDGSRIWTVENSADQLNYTSGSQLVDVHKDNPAEEVNEIDLSNIGKFYGYPQCFTVWDMKSVVSDTNLNTGDQFSIASNVTDAQCGNSTYNVPPKLSMQAHSAPLDMVFYSAPSDTSAAVNTGYNGHAFVSFHGSWNRDPPTGYGIVRIPWSGNGPSSSVDSKEGYNFIVQAPDMNSCPGECFRPVGLAFDQRGRLFGSSDSTGEIFIVQAGGALTRKLLNINLGWVVFGLLATYLAV